MTVRADSDGPSTGYDPSAQLQSIDGATLTALVRQALGSESVAITSWSSQQIHGGYSYGAAGGSAIHRFSGKGSEQGEGLDWSLILKVLYPPAEP